MRSTGRQTRTSTERCPPNQLNDGLGRSDRPVLFENERERRPASTTARCPLNQVRAESASKSLPRLKGRTFPGPARSCDGAQSGRPACQTPSLRSRHAHCSAGASVSYLGWSAAWSRPEAALVAGERAAPPEGGIPARAASTSARSDPRHCKPACSDRSRGIYGDIQSGGATAPPGNRYCLKWVRSTVR